MGRGVYRSRQVRRRRIGAVLVLVGVAVVAWLAVTVPSSPSPPPRDGTTRGPSTTIALPPTTSPPATTTTTTTTTQPPKPVRQIGTFGVATTSLAIVEPPPSPGAPARNLPTAIWYPVPNAAANVSAGESDGPYPLLVFSQGFGVAVQAYATLLTDWASAGFVVAAPTYPDTAPTSPRADIVNHPHDLQVVLATLLAAARRSGSVLSGLVDATAVGLVGQSDGGDVSLAVAENSAWHDPVVKAVAVLSGAEIPAFGGTYFSGATMPILVVQSDTDTINAPACSVQIYDAAPSPKWYLELFGATHLQPYTQPGSYETAVAATTTLFFDGELAGERAALTALGGAGTVPGISQLTAGGTAPPAPSATGACTQAI